MNKSFTEDLVSRGLIESFLRPLLKRLAGEVSDELMQMVTAIFAQLSQIESTFQILLRQVEIRDFFKVLDSWQSIKISQNIMKTILNLSLSRQATYEILTHQR